MEVNKLIEDFFESGNIAVVGATDNKIKFGYKLLSELKAKGFNIYPVNPARESVDGDKCYKSINDLPSVVENAIFVLQPEKARKVIEEIGSSGIKRIWMQQGSESEEAVNLCKKNNIPVVSKKCVLMYAPPVKSFHKFHRGVWKLFGKL